MVRKFLSALAISYRRIAPPMLALLTAVLVWGTFTADWIDPPTAGAQAYTIIRPRSGGLLIRSVAPAEPSPAATSFVYPRSSTQFPVGPIIWGRGHLNAAGWRAATWELHVGFGHLWWLSLVGAFWAMSRTLTIRPLAAGESSEDLLRQIRHRTRWLIGPTLAMFGLLLILWAFASTHGGTANVGNWSFSARDHSLEIEHRTSPAFAPFDRMPGRLGPHLTVVPPVGIVAGSFGGAQSWPGRPEAAAVNAKISLRTLALLAIVPVLLSLLAIRRYAALRRRLRSGLCPQCGYDLRATPLQCPECGYARTVTHADA